MTSGASTVIRAPAEAERSTVIALSVGESATGQIVGVCGCVWSGGYKGNKKRMRLAPKKKKQQQTNIDLGCIKWGMSKSMRDNSTPKHCLSYSFID